MSFWFFRKRRHFRTIWRLKMAKYIYELFDDISEFTVRDFASWIKSVPDDAHVILQILSHGGLAFCGIGVAGQIQYAKQRGVRFTAQVFGLAASAGADIVFACDNIQMAQGASIMIHSAYDPCEFCNSDGSHEEDPGIVAANEAQMLFIKKHMPEYTKEDLKKDNWISAEECVKRGIASYLTNSEVVAIYPKIAAKYKSFSGGGEMENEEKKQMAENEVVETEDVKAEETTVEDILESLVNRLDEIEHRLAVLEGEGKKADDELAAECSDASEKKEARLKAIYAKVCARCGSFEKPVIEKLKAENSKETQEKELKEFRSRVNVKDYIR